MLVFDPSGIIAGMVRYGLAALAFSACTSPQYEAWQDEQAKYASTSGSSTGPSTNSTTGEMNGDTTAGGAEGATSTGTNDAGETGPANDTSTGAATADSTPSGPPVGDADRPHIVSIELPANVHAAGPVPLQVQTERTASVQVRLDGLDAGELLDAGDGLFTGELAVHGAVDNGEHEVEIIAHQGELEDSELAAYEVSTPAPGTMAWFKAGPPGSRTNRVALTPEGDLLEGGQLEINKLTRPSLRKRSSLTGAELWSVTLDTREGSVADLAALPDGRVWVAMNVRGPGDPSPQPRIALFDPAGEFTGLETVGDLGQGVRGIAADATGGCFAVGYAPAGGDLDVAFWRLDAKGLQTLAGVWDYVPGAAKDHSFWDFAMDVVIDHETAWVIGTSKGEHQGDTNRPTRGLALPMDLHTGKLLTPAIVAPASVGFPQNVFFGGTLHPTGLLVTGYGCDTNCSKYRIETSLYSPSGDLTWSQHDLTGIGSRNGNDVAYDSQGRVIIAATVQEDGAPRGYVFARTVGEKAALPLFEHWFPASKPSEALGVLVDAYDRIFPAGYITSGATQARIELIHG